jgi:hypothetical protein
MTGRAYDLSAGVGVTVVWWSRGGKVQQLKKIPTQGLGGNAEKGHTSRSSLREGVFVTAIEAGLLTYGSSYSPTPSQPSRGQWPALLVFVPAHSGASVRDLHPLPVSRISIARIAVDCQEVSSGAAHVKSHMTAHRLCSERSARFAIAWDFNTQTLVTPAHQRAGF